jgi:uncharacterized membrane protein YjjP (DUF1212 family)
MGFMGEWGSAAVSVLAAIIGLAIVAVVVSKNAQTSSVIQAGGSALSGIIGAAVAPVSGGNTFGSTSNVNGVSQ